MGLKPPKCEELGEFSFFASDPSKAYFEKFSLVWTPLSLVFLLAGVFGTGLWKVCGKDEFLAISVAACVPGFVWPIMFPGVADSKLRFWDRFWVKAAVWISIFSFYGNYFWTHYFYSLLGAKYLFESYMFNDVPVVTYLCTYFYFTFYFSLVNVVLRLFDRAIQKSGLSGWPASMLRALAVFFLSVATAVFEAVSIQHFPLYTYDDKFTFLTIGSVVYGIYFMVGFPMFFALDEHIYRKGPEESEEKTVPGHIPPGRLVTTPGNVMESCSLWYVTQNAFAAVAIVTVLLDFWRLFIGDIYSFTAASTGVPFLYRS